MSSVAVGRVALIGLDAAQWSLVESMMADGDLPHLSALRQRAAVAHLRHADYRTGLVWEHFLTGRGAAGSGRWSAVRFDPTTYDVTKEGALPHTPFFAGIPGQTICFDVPYLSLGGAFDAVAVTAWGGHDPAYPRASSPRGLLREIEAEFGPHPAFDNDYAIVWNRPAAMHTLVDALVDGAHRRGDIALWLMERFPEWQAFITVLSEPHSAAEQLWHGIAPEYPVSAVVDAPEAGRRLREVYRAVDDTVGRIVAGLPPDTTVVAFTMHGTGTNDADVASMVLLPELLHRLHGGSPFLHDPDQDAWARQGYPLVVPRPDQPWDQYMNAQLPASASPRRRSARERFVAAMPRAMRDALRGARDQTGSRPAPRLGALGIPIAEETDASPEEIGVPIDPIEWQITHRYRAHWPEMRAFAIPTFYDGRVRINLEGREHDGVVKGSDYEQACQEVEAAISDCRDPRSGEPVVAEFVRLRADDPWAPDGADADIQIIWSRPLDAVEHPQAGTIGPFPFRRTGGHTPDGFAFVAGPGITPGELGVHDALAVTATAVALLGGEPNGYEAGPLPIFGDA